MERTTAALFASMFFVALASGAPASSYAQTAQAQAKEDKAAQREKDFEHEILQSDGGYHPREIVKPGKASKTSSKPAAPRAKTQRELDLEHEVVQSDGVNHPREKVRDKSKLAPQKNGATTAPRKTQRELDLEHDMVQSDGVNHPREIVKK